MDSVRTPRQQARASEPVRQALGTLYHGARPAAGDSRVLNRQRQNIPNSVGKLKGKEQGDENAYNALLRKTLAPPTKPSEKASNHHRSLTSCPPISPTNVSHKRQSSLDLLSPPSKAQHTAEDLISNSSNLSISSSSSPLNRSSSLSNLSLSSPSSPNSSILSLLSPRMSTSLSSSSLSDSIFSPATPHFNHSYSLPSDGLDSPLSPIPNQLSFFEPTPQPQRQHHFIQPSESQSIDFPSFQPSHSNPLMTQARSLKSARAPPQSSRSAVSQAPFTSPSVSSSSSSASTPQLSLDVDDVMFEPSAIEITPAIARPSGFPLAQATPPPLSHQPHTAPRLSAGELDIAFQPSPSPTSSLLTLPSSYRPLPRSRGPPRTTASSTPSVRVAKPKKSPKSATPSPSFSMGLIR